jgi:hypothetical protein
MQLSKQSKTTFVTSIGKLDSKQSQGLQLLNERNAFQ